MISKNRRTEKESDAEGDQPQQGDDQKPGRWTRRKGQSGRPSPAKTKRRGEPGEKPEPRPGSTATAGSKGEAKPAQPQPGEQKQDAKEEEAADAQAAAAGKMTEQQAKSLLDSLKGEDQKVRLLDPRQQRRSGRVLRDW